MAKKKPRSSPKPKSKKPPTRKARAGRKRAARPATATQVTALLEEMSLTATELVADPARSFGAAAAGPAPGVAPAPAAAAAVAVGRKAVSFTCSNAQCLVGITVGSINVVFTGTGGSLYPTGAFIAHWRVKGSGAFQITASGATLSPISSTAPDAGLANLVVAP